MRRDDGEGLAIINHMGALMDDRQHLDNARWVDLLHKFQQKRRVLPRQNRP